MGSAGPIYDKSIPQMERKCQGRVVVYLLSEDKKGTIINQLKRKYKKVIIIILWLVALHAT